MRLLEKMIKEDVGVKKFIWRGREGSLGNSDIEGRGWGR